MITASHNPPADNGYKLYLGDGAQIVPPADAEIEAAIRDLGPLARVRLAPPDSPLITELGDEVAAAYLDRICAASPAPPDAAWLRFVYTPLHGVAGELALRAFEQAGFTAPDVVAAQAAPDPDFPTVAFPNPEEPGALDLALAQARRSGADLVLANDPDGDRLAVAVPDPQAPGGWRTLTGDQVGALLGAYLLEQAPAGQAPAEPAGGHARSCRPRCCPGSPRPPARSTRRRSPASSGSSGPATRARAAGSCSATRRRSGYAVGDIVRDKDGIGAALALLGLAARARSGGRVAARRLRRARDRPRRAPDRPGHRGHRRPRWRSWRGCGRPPRPGSATRAWSRPPT